MKMQINDGVVQFATHFIKANITDETVKQLRGLQTAINGITCYTIEEKEKAENGLTQLNIPFITEILTVSDEYINKVKDVKYNSRSEAIAHLQEEIEMPNSEIIPYLKKERNNLRIQLDQVIVEKEELKIKNKQVGDALLQMMFKK
jgi:hypothetical protein